MAAFIVDLLSPAPSSGLTVLSALLAAAAAWILFRAERRRASRRPNPQAPAGALRTESPAVVNLLTTDARVTAGALRATVIDLAARGWLRLLPPHTDDELGRVRPAADADNDDALAPHERLALQHVMARYTTDEAIPAQYLAVDVHGAWWRRFRRLVVADATSAQLVERRWRGNDLAAPAALVTLALLTLLQAASGGAETAVVDSIERRLIAGGLLAAIVWVAVRIVRHGVRADVVLTDTGVGAAEEWLAVRRRLVERGFGPMAPSAVELGDRRLAYATAMLAAQGAVVELPLARDDHFRTWSSVGGEQRLVSVRYPLRPGYGMHPVVALIGGAVAFFVGLRLRRWFSDVAREETFDWIFERAGESDWIVIAAASTFAVLSMLPILIGLWLTFAGAVDVFMTNERTGVVVRARRPAEVAPLPRSLRRLLDRERYSLYVAIDDGTESTITAWRATERTAIPQGSRAIVTATPMLGYVRKSLPVGHRLPA